MSRWFVDDWLHWQMHVVVVVVVAAAAAVVVVVVDQICKTMKLLKTHQRDCPVVLVAVVASRVPAREVARVLV
jgi:hypothetical protein